MSTALEWGPLCPQATVMHWAEAMLQVSIKACTAWKRCFTAKHAQHGTCSFEHFQCCSVSACAPVMHFLYFVLTMCSSQVQPASRSSMSLKTIPQLNVLFVQHACGTGLYLCCPMGRVCSVKSDACMFRKVFVQRYHVKVWLLKEFGGCSMSLSYRLCMICGVVGMVFPVLLVLFLSIPSSSRPHCPDLQLPTMWACSALPKHYFYYYWSY